MWECSYGREPLDLKLLVLRLVRKSWILLLAAVLGAVFVGGPYFLKKVVFGPAKEYEAVTDFYIDYAKQENGEEYTYFNQTTWTQLITDDVFTDKILTELSGKEADTLQEKEGAAGITKQQLREYLYATMLSDTRIVTTTVTTNSADMTMKINQALIKAMFSFGEEQKEIAGVRILQEPAEASPVIADVRTFRACMSGVVLFVFVTAIAMLLYYVLDDSIYVPATFERRYGVPMLGTINSTELPALAGKLLKRTPVLITSDQGIDLEQAGKALREREIETAGVCGLWQEKELPEGPFLLLVKAAAHNGKQIEKTLEFCAKCELPVMAALLWDADEKLLRAYEMPEFVMRCVKVLRQKQPESKNTGKAL